MNLNKLFTKLRHRKNTPARNQQAERHEQGEQHDGGHREPVDDEQPPHVGAVSLTPTPRTR